RRSSDLHCVLVSQGTAGIPIRDSAQLMTPYLSLNRYRIRIETLAADSTRGKKNVERKNTRNQLGMRDCTRTASSIATPSCAATANTTKMAVFRKEIATVESVAMSVKFRSPTNCGAVMMSQRKKASTREPMIGSRTKMPMPIMVGARKIQRSTADERSVLMHPPQ